MRTAENPTFSLIIVGAGPAGLLLALLLAKKDVPVMVLEKSSAFHKEPRATFHGLPATHEFRRAGIYDDVAARGFHVDGVSWRYPDGTRIASMYFKDTDPTNGQISLPLDELLPLIASHLEKQPSAQVLMNHEVVASGQNDQLAWVETKTPDGEKRFEATYMVGCDGASSRIRQDLFGKSFPGYTWDKQIIATDVRWSGFSKLHWDTSSNFVVHSDHFPMISQMTKDGQLRITYGEDGSLSAEDILVRQPEIFKSFLVGNPEPSEYEICNFSPYKIHQRLVSNMRVGRIIVIADAAHLCNPFGGLGLNGGLADAGGLYDCLYGIFANRADESILDKYDEVRRSIYQNIIDPSSSSMLRRLWEPEKVEQDEFIMAVKRMEVDKEFAKQASKGATAIMHDFTQYYVR